jgi:hypothetical protein
LIMKALAPGTVIFHRYRGYGVIVSINLMTGWIAARFGNEARPLNLNLSSDEVQYADGEPIRFRRMPPDRMPHARLMAMVRELHRAGYQRLYLYSWPKPSGLHWRWHLFTGRRNWMERSWREGWYGSGADYNFNPTMGWGEAPGASVDELISALAKFDPQGLAQALGRDEDHAEWLDTVCQALLPNYGTAVSRPHPHSLSSRCAPGCRNMPGRRYPGRRAGPGYGAMLASQPGRPVIFALPARHPM